MSSILRPHPEIPDHYDIAPGYVLVTSDAEQHAFKWSRLIRKNYISKRGFLSHLENERIGVCLYKETSTGNFDLHDPDGVAKEIEDLIPLGTEAIFHYNEPGVVNTIVLGVKPTILKELPEQYRGYYYDTL